MKKHHFELKNYVMATGVFILWCAPRQVDN